MLEYALYAASRGKPVFPCNLDKKPLTKNGFKDATDDPNVIKQWHTQYPEYMLAMPTGTEETYTVLDVDINQLKDVDGNDSLSELEARYDRLPDTPEVMTPRGGRHIYFQYVPGLKNSAGKLGPGLDIRGEGGYVIAPPSRTADGRRYEWEASSPSEFARMPQWMIDILMPGGTKRRQGESRKSNGSDEPARHTEGSRNATLSSMAGSMRRKGFSEAAIEAALLAENAKVCEPPLPDDEVSKIARSISRYEPEPDTPLPPPESKTNTDWRDYLLYDKEEKPRSKSQHNACIYLTYHTAARGVFAHNLFSRKIILKKRPPWDAVDGDYPRSMEDTDITLAVGWLERQGLAVNHAGTHAAIQTAARHYAFDPLRDYLEGLRWDGQPRLAGWLVRFMGCEATEYVEAVGRRFLIGAVARALQPGCQMDTMLILEGNQGVYKSSAISTLFSKEWYTDEIHAIGSKDAAMQLQGHWGIEIPEMHAMSRAEANQIKEWITRRVDKYRPPYGRMTVESNRRCALIGTLNPEGGYLKDATGGRRFWPVMCHVIDLEALKAERDQLWAEAVKTYREGEQWWLTDEEQRLSLVEQDARYETEPWDAEIDAYIQNRDAVTTSEVMEAALELPKRDWTRAAEMRVAKYLVKSGRVRKRMRLPLQGLRWVYAKSGVAYLKSVEN